MQESVLISLSQLLPLDLLHQPTAALLPLALPLLTVLGALLTRQPRSGLQRTQPGLPETALWHPSATGHPLTAQLVQLAVVRVICLSQIWQVMIRLMLKRMTCQLLVSEML